MKQPFAQPIASSDHAFTALVAASRASLNARLQRHGSGTSRVRFFIAGRELITDLDDYLPNSQDTDASSFFARVGAQVEDQPFECIAYELQEQSVAIWSALRRFLRGLYQQIGLPAARAEAILFLRNHAHTSLGLHRDDGGVFAFVLAGHKRILAWPESAMAGQEEFLATTRYAQFRDQAIVLEGRPGDVLYWPSNHWHVGESDHGPSISLNLVLRTWPPAMDALRQLSQLAQHQVRDELTPTWPFDPEDLSTSAEQVPSAMVSPLHAARAISAGGNIERYLEFAWLKRVTGAGFFRVPPPEPAQPLLEDDMIQVARDEPIIHITLGDGRIACSVAGHAFIVSSPHFPRLLTRLTPGTRHQVGPLLRSCIEPNDEADNEGLGQLHGILEKLLRFRALRHGP